MSPNKESFNGMKIPRGSAETHLLSFRAEDLQDVLQSAGIIEENTVVKLSEEDEEAIMRSAEIKMQNDPQLLEEEAITEAYRDRMVYLIGSGTDYLERLDNADAAKLVSEMTGITVSPEELDLFKKFAKDNTTTPFTDMIEQWIKGRQKAIEGVAPLTAMVDGSDNVIKIKH